MRGYFEIGIYQAKFGGNVGALWRSAYQLGASGIFCIGQRYRDQASDTYNTWKHVPFRQYISIADFYENMPKSALLVGIEFPGEPLSKFIHPERAIYLLGAEDNGLPKAVLSKCHRVISIEHIRTPSFNVAIAGAIVMYHRLLQRRDQLGVLGGG